MVTKKDWIAALPRYKRGQGFFRTLDDKYCPLGVLADLIIKDGNIPGVEWVKGESSYELRCDGKNYAFEWPIQLRLLTGITIEAYHLYRFNDSDDADNPKSVLNSGTPWAGIQEWMIKVSSGKDKTPAIPEFDTKKPSGVLA